MNSSPLRCWPVAVSLMVSGAGRLARRGAGTGRWRTESPFLIYSRNTLRAANLPQRTEPDRATHAQPVRFPRRPLSLHSDVDPRLTAQGKCAADRGVLIVSPRMTREVRVTTSLRPIHYPRFCGFDPALYDITYPATGHPALVLLPLNGCARPVG